MCREETRESRGRGARRRARAHAPRTAPTTDENDIGNPKRRLCTRATRHGARHGARGATTAAQHRRTTQYLRTPEREELHLHPIHTHGRCTSAQSTWNVGQSQWHLGQPAVKAARTGPTRRARLDGRRCRCGPMASGFTRRRRHKEEEDGLLPSQHMPRGGRAGSSLECNRAKDRQLEPLPEISLSGLAGQAEYVHAGLRRARAQWRRHRDKNWFG